MSTPTAPARGTTDAPTTGGTTAAKAWAAAAVSGLLAFLTAISTALGGTDPGWDSITPGQWTTAVTAAVVAFAGAAGITFVVPNKPR